MDLAKTDSLFIFLLLAAFVIEHTSKSRISLMISGLTYSLAYMTKQTALPVLVLYAPISLIISNGKSLMIWVSFIVSVVVSIVGLNFLSGGWFVFYTHSNIASHSIAPDLFVFPRKFVRTA